MGYDKIWLHNTLKVRPMAFVSVMVILVIGAFYFIYPQAFETTLSQFRDRSYSVKVLYRKGDDLFLFNPATKEKQKVLSSSNLLDFDLSPDAALVAYSLGETGFPGNSDIYLKNLANNTVVRLTENDKSVALNPVIFPDNNKIAYVRRDYDAKKKALTDGEIWIIDADGNEESSRKILTPPAITGIEEDDNPCVSDEEKQSVKIGINSISPSGEIIDYWIKDNGIECSGLMQFYRLATTDGLRVVGDKLTPQNPSLFDPQKDLSLSEYRSLAHWISDSEFITSTDFGPPTMWDSLLVINKKDAAYRHLYTEVPPDYQPYEVKANFGQLWLHDVRTLRNKNILILYWLSYSDPDARKYFVKEVSLRSDLTANDLEKGYVIASTTTGGPQITPHSLKFVSDDEIVYLLEKEEGNSTLHLYNTATGTDEVIDESSDPMIVAS